MIEGDRWFQDGLRLRGGGSSPSLRVILLLVVGAAAHAVPAAASDFYTVTPCRLVDTRLADGPLAGPALGANASRTFVVPGHCGIPLAATALSVNVVVVAPSAAGHLTIHASGTTSPVTSTLNYAEGQTRANNAVAALGADGGLTVDVSQTAGTTQLVLDVNGYFATAGCSAEQTPARPAEMAINLGDRMLTWSPVAGATSYNVYIRAVVGSCGLLGPQSVTRSDQLLSNVSSPLDVSPPTLCGSCFFVDLAAVSGECESRLYSDDGLPAPLGFSLSPCTP